MTKLALTDNLLDQKNLIAVVSADLAVLRAVFNQQKIAELELPAPDSLAGKLAQACELILKFEEEENKAVFEQTKSLLRRYVFLIKRYKDKLYPTENLKNLEDKLVAIFDVIGRVPRLNSELILPAKEYLPVKFEASKEIWQRKECLKPKDEVYFFRRDNKASVREELESEIEQQKLLCITQGENKQILNFVDLNYYSVDLMHVDHLQASTSLIPRLMEMIEAMNDDPTFRDEMLKSPFNKNYFIMKSATEVVGNLWLYLAYYNSLQNLWFLLACDNVGKRAADPVEWLKTFETGHSYLMDLATHGIAIDISDILYSVVEVASDDEKQKSIPLKDSFTQWLSRKKGYCIKITKDLTEYFQRRREKIQQESDISRGEARFKRLLLRVGEEVTDVMQAQTFRGARNFSSGIIRQKQTTVVEEVITTSSAETAGSDSERSSSKSFMASVPSDESPERLDNMAKKVVAEPGFETRFDGMIHYLVNRVARKPKRKAEADRQASDSEKQPSKKVQP